MQKENSYEIIDSIEKIDEKMESIIQTVKKYYPSQESEADIRKAYELAKEAHGLQKRRSGEPYLVHPVAVAEILSQYHMDPDTIIAALLHDVIEDTKYTYDDLLEIFNERIAFMVESVSKITRMSFQSKEESHNAYIRKMVLAMAYDMRVILIKLVDRLHNMRTLEYMSTDKQVEKSIETLEIYAPIANQLGIQSIKSELEDLAFKYLEPAEYLSLEKELEKLQENSKEYVDLVKNEIETVLEEADIKAKVYGRTKTLYGLYQKMKNQHREFNEIFDVFAFRVITETVEECYLALGAIHTHWKAIPTRMKDYITNPKKNGYQSFHTTVIGPEGVPVEIQIRTKDMHEVNEYGIAAHWRYKENQKKGRVKRDKNFDNTISWLRQLLDWTRDTETPNDFVSVMKVDILDQETYVYTPKGQVIDLPAGSCPIDFAYRIHTDIGNYCTGAKVNGKLVPLNYELKLGDIVEIIVDKKKEHGPQSEWLRFVKSSHAKNKIKQFLKLESKEENIKIGKLLLENELRKITPHYKEILTKNNIQLLASEMDFKSGDDLLAGLGSNGIKIGTILKEVKELFTEYFPVEKEEIVIVEPHIRKYNGEIIVNNESNIDSHLARCCNPLPGDPIIGNITKNGISIHRADCKNIATTLDSDRIVDVKWNKDHHGKEFYTTNIFIKAYSKNGGLVNVLQPFYNMNLPILSTNSRTDENRDYFSISCEVNSLEQIDRLLNELKNIKEVISAKRN